MDYNEAQSLLNALEAEQEKKTITIDLKKAFSASIEIKQYDERDVARIVEMLDGLGEAGQQKAKDEKPRGPAAGPKIGRAGAAVQKMEQGVGRITNLQKQQARQMFSKQELGSIAGDIHSMFGNIRGMRPTKKVESPRKEYANALVLASLSLQDQLAELEKISVGIDKGLFSKSQIEIIKYEIKGLSASRKGQAAQGLDMGLLQLRDSRLKEVINKLGLK